MNRLLAFIVLGLATALLGCSRETLPMTHSSDAPPPVDLRRLVFQSDGITVDTLESDKIVLVTDTWILSGQPVDDRGARRIAAALNGVVRRNSGCLADVIKASSTPTTIHRFLRGVTGDGLAVQGDYLVHIAGYWISCLVGPREPDGTFNVRSIDSLLLTLSLSDAPRAGVEILAAWKQYQKAREPGTPNGKFVLSMDPAPVYLGSYQDYLEVVRSPRRADLLPTLADEQRGGRRLNPKIIEFYTKDDPISIRVDVWLGSKPKDKMDRTVVYADELQVTSPVVELWSSADPYPLTAEPGLYDVRIMLVHRGHYEGRILTDREKFEQDDLERYEIIMTLKQAR